MDIIYILHKLVNIRDLLQGSNTILALNELKIVIKYIQKQKRDGGKNGK